jgi:tripartite-type tricarboxylate transporter receptor subunit TctC
MKHTSDSRRDFLIKSLSAGAALSTGAGLLDAAHGQASDYPNKPIRVIVPFPAGSATDISMRLLETVMSRVLGQSLIIDNRPGASGAIGADLGKRAAPDGYTILMDAASSHSVLAAMRPTTLPYNILTDFTAIGRACTSANVVAVNPKLPVRNLKELIEYSQTQPGGLSFAAGGGAASNRLAGELLALRGAKLTHVPYVNLNQAITDTASGNVPVIIYTVSLLPFIRDGRLRGIATFSEKRLSQEPLMPTAVEQGIDVVAMSWFGLFGPARLPLPIRDRLYNALREAINDPVVNRKLIDAGLEPALLNPAETDAFVTKDMAKWKEVVRLARVPLEE